MVPRLDEHHRVVVLDREQRDGRPELGAQNLHRGPHRLDRFGGAAGPELRVRVDRLELGQLRRAPLAGAPRQRDRLPRARRAALRGSLDDVEVAEGAEGHRTGPGRPLVPGRAERERLVEELSGAHGIAQPPVLPGKRIEGPREERRVRRVRATRELDRAPEELARPLVLLQLLVAEPDGHGERSVDERLVRQLGLDPLACSLEDLARAERVPARAARRRGVEDLREEQADSLRPARLDTRPVRLPLRLVACGDRLGVEETHADRRARDRERERHDEPGDEAVARDELADDVGSRSAGARGSGDPRGGGRGRRRARTRSRSAARAPSRAP